LFIVLKGLDTGLKKKFSVIFGRKEKISFFFEKERLNKKFKKRFFFHFFFLFGIFDENYFFTFSKGKKSYSEKLQ